MFCVLVATSFVARTASGAERHNRAASLFASSINSSAEQTFQTKPISRALSAGIDSPRSKSSIASDQFNFLGKRIAPTIVGIPIVTSG